MTPITQEDASQKWCPFGRVAWATQGERTRWTTSSQFSFNRAKIERTDQEVPVSMCIGARCMAWQWADGRGSGPVDTVIVCDGEPELPKIDGHFWAKGEAVEAGIVWGLFPRVGCCALMSGAAA